MRILLICPVPIEFTSCRSLLVAARRRHRGGLPLRARIGGRPRDGGRAVGAGQGPRGRGRGGGNPGSSHPDLVVDTGTCGALDAGLVVGAVVIGRSCVEYDISGSGLPRRIIPEMRLPSALALLPRPQRGQAGACRRRGRPGDRPARAARERRRAASSSSNRPAVRDSLAALTGALAANWETAGVFVAALRAGPSAGEPPCGLGPRGRAIPAGLPAQHARGVPGAVPFRTIARRVRAGSCSSTNAGATRGSPAARLCPSVLP